MGEPWDDRTLVFISGLHRSGTTQLHATMATHPDVGALLGTTAPHDEGQHLQDVFPTARRHGGPGRFAHDPRSHLTESDASPGDARRLFAQWARVWPDDRRVLIEKSPPNLIRMRYLQGLFPDARFVVVVRHPAAVALATQKLATGFWRRRLGRAAPLGGTLRHWTAAHRLLLEDLPHVSSRVLFRWEDLGRDPVGVLDGVADLAGLGPGFEPVELDPTVDAAYAERWAATPRDRTLAAAVEEAREVAACFGYDLDDLTALGRVRAG
ncbi:hypothetical protein GCM10011519_22970 [Marmoricola endophyticus]|uniref:Sulfotransferase n=1 Tax=Marmoricola endophyticus TaxID=2040280 RepID=A0A917BJZ5_9ACTN|nr:sulfotransferase [Marmoricola endophyticus]GGF48369.1 hypothetical protein GCM10011519_22970 [Marmoricola endophyticus]